jgi:uroporphyrin-III C-methyltransferase
VSLTTAMTHLGSLQATRTADTEVFYMAGRQLAALSSKLREAGWPGDTPASVVSNAGWPDARCTDHTVATLADATTPHADRPAVVTVGAGALPITAHGTSGTSGTANTGTKTPSLERHQAMPPGHAA